jgi:alanine dehydrogenase
MMYSLSAHLLFSLSISNFVFISLTTLVHSYTKSPVLPQCYSRVISRYARNISIGIPKEIKSGENRVGITPAGVQALVSDGHKVMIQKDAGLGSGISNDAFKSAGAKIIDTAAEIWKSADMICKVKEPVKDELTSMRPDQLVFGYFHFASGPELTKACVKSKAVCLAYETVTTPARDHPLLTPMSEVAGRIAVHQGASLLEKHRGGAGVLVGGVPGVLPAKCLVIGGGVVGTHSAKLLAGLGGDVILMDVSLPRLRELSMTMPANVKLQYSNRVNLMEALKSADLVIGGVYISGAKVEYYNIYIYIYIGTL